jgi:outer membrane protein OmpA-like peptidoglycan-associated protein/tetratricopeptide (TPR) repeat protein
VKDIKRSIASFLFCFAAVTLQAQISGINDLSTFQLKRYARSAVNNGDIHTAIVFYEKYREYKSRDNKVNYALAELHREARNYIQAMDLYEEVVRTESKTYPLAQFYYAQMLKTTGNYDKAIEQFEEFRRNYKGGKDSKTYGRLARSEIAGCDSAKLILQNPKNITISTMNKTVNGPHIEFSPIPVNNSSFIYGSLRVDSLIYFTPQNIDSVKPVRQFYRARKEGMDWIGGELLEDFNIPGVETGNGIFSRDGKRFYFTRCETDWQGNIICAIYRSSWKEGKWTDAVKLPPLINDPNFTTTQPALGRTAKSDREVIYYVSNNPDGRGGLDLWYTVWNEEKDQYSTPRNLGSRINTAGDEMTPFYNISKRTLYYSSTGLAGIGGLDVFKVFGERRKWETVGNIGSPVNSSYDDLYFTVSQTGEDGFFVSNRPDSINNITCCDDIFYYRWNDFIRITVTGVIYPFESDRFGRKRDLSGFDFMNPDASIKPLDQAKVALYQQNKDTKEFVFLDRYSTGPNGRFYFTLEPDQDYEFKMEGFQYFDSKNYLSTQFFNFSDTIEMPPTWVNVYSEKPIVLENIYYEFNSAELSRASKNVLDTTLLVLLKEAPEFIIEIGAHTDSIGDFKYNMKLSQDRAANVVNYLVSKGIPAIRLVPKGYGSQNPVAPNFNPDGSDNVAGREKNRRTEFRIVGTIGGDDEEDEVFVGTK